MASVGALPTPSKVCKVLQIETLSLDFAVWPLDRVAVSMLFEVG